MENNSIIESLIKSKEEVQAFIDEQKSKYAGTDICQFSAEDIRSFMGKEFMEATHLPQHDVPFKETPSRAPGIEKRLKSVCE